ncbi:flippase-like domain-containing protein [Myxococcus stipitatus]|uniref:lysylphosphatidylglycerol synthase domain-containing protein n=1 Tax=Myxococcus stipitatus TaxID=83455 RepID=UPI001F1B4D50|nr:lysylphosphatidylglycerol synthase domain-containing protein [Myxococcus stipitatus]MCE9673111.1 flippase-like domain-containing protein [Myxococcus stipitatus]
MGNARGEAVLVRPVGVAVAARPARVPWRRKVVGLMRPLFAVAGLGMLALLVRKVGPRELGDVLLDAAPWLPWVALLEVGRQGMDALATRSAYGPSADQVPMRELMRAQLIGTAVSSMAPAGRAAAEATKAALLAPYLGGARATAAAATSQSASLAAGGLISFPCAAASFLLTGWSAFTLAMLGHGVVLVLACAGVRACMRARRPCDWLASRSARWSQHTAQFRASACHGPLLPRGPMLAFLGSRMLQVVQYGVLTHAVGIDTSAVQALFSQGLYLCALAVGSLVPGQVGVSDGAFALAAGVLDTTAARAMSVALLNHLVQLVFVAAGALTPLVWRVRVPVPSVPAPACR